MPNNNSEWPRRFDTSGLPFDAYEVVEVQFLAANTDTSVSLPEAFVTEDPSRIGYIPLSMTSAAIIYDSRGIVGGFPWTPQLAWLRSTVAPLTVTLLLVLRRPR